MRKNTSAPKKPSATDAKPRASTSPGGEDILSPIKEENTEDDFSKLPEVQGSSVAQGITGDGLMEPLSEQQKEFLQSCIDDTRNRLEAAQRDERRFYEEEMARMREQINGRNA